MLACERQLPFFINYCKAGIKTTASGGSAVSAIDLRSKASLWLAF